MHWSLTLTHRPKLRDIAALAAEHDLVVVALMEREGGQDLAERWRAAGVDAIQVDYGIKRDRDDGQLPAAGRLVAERLTTGSRVLVHCSAGLHRTGMIAFEALRNLGMDEADAVKEIRRIRGVTGEAVVELLSLRDAGLKAADRDVGRLDPPGTLDIRFGAPYPAGTLSNLAAHPFTFDGVQCASMEGFLQSLKTADEDVASLIRGLVGKEAKRAGRGLKPVGGVLHWDGREVHRDGDEYQRLLDSAYQALFDQNDDVQRALAATGDLEITHRSGSNDSSVTILSSVEFCSRLTRLRARAIGAQQKVDE